MCACPCVGMYACVYVCLSLCEYVYISVMLRKARRGHRIPWIWTFRRLWDTGHVSWEPTESFTWKVFALHLSPAPPHLLINCFLPSLFWYFNRWFDSLTVFFSVFSSLSFSADILQLAMLTKQRELILRIALGGGFVTVPTFQRLQHYWPLWCADTGVCSLWVRKPSVLVQGWCKLLLSS